MVAKYQTPHNWSVLILLFLFILFFSFSSKVLAASSGWFDSSRDYRISIEVSAGSFSFYNKPVSCSIDFTTLLAENSASGSLAEESLEMVETDGSGNIIDSTITFQFDKADGYDASSNARGTLVFIMEGNTNSSTTRYYNLYYDVSGDSFTQQIPPVMVNLVDSTVVDEGQVSYQISAENGTYYYHKAGAGFSSINDVDGNDWVGYNVGNINYSYRGIPNLGVCGHPGYNGSDGNLASTSTLKYIGPAHIKIHSISSDNKWEFEWNIYPEYATMTLLTRDTSLPYWLVYEGTPGGTFNTDDFMVRNDGSTFTLDQNWSTSLDSLQWSYFGDNTLDRSMYFIHHEADSEIDSYRPHAVSPEYQMTIFGFGRTGSSATLTSTPAHFTIGIAETQVQSEVEALINSAVNEPSVTVTSDTPLPVELTSFSAEVIDNIVTLKWQTASETDNYGFEVERKSFDANRSSLSGNLGGFTSIGFVEGAGNSNTAKSYSFNDPSSVKVLNGKFVYRLKQIDLDGQFTYSKEVEVQLENVPTEFALEQNYPNPFNPTTIIKYSLPNASRITLKVYNILGQEVATLVNKQQPAGNYEVKFDAADLPSGIYFYQLQAGDFSNVKRMLLVK